LIRLRARSTLTVTVIGTTQTLAWASSYYLPAILAQPIAAGLGVPRSLFFAFYSAALLVQAALGPAIGRAIDRRGGRGVLVLSNLVLGAGLILLASAHGVAGLAAAWALLGIGMALGLYDSAFATLASLYGAEARAAITGITLIAGFASTVGWPVSALLDDAFGWRGACLAWAAVNLAVCLPINRFVLPLPARREASGQPAAADGAGPAHGMAVLGFVFAAAAFVSGAMGAHLPRLLEIAGATPAAAIFAASLMGPAQVAARLFEFGLLQRLHPLIAARLAVSLHPIGAAVLGLAGGPAAVAFALFHGGGNGLVTIARGTVPLALWGAGGYGLRTGWLAAPARVATAAAPLLFGFAMDAMGAGALFVSAVLSLGALAGLLLLRARPAAAETLPS
jgi:MFS family permease